MAYEEHKMVVLMIFLCNVVQFIYSHEESLNYLDSSDDLETEPIRRSDMIDESKSYKGLPIDLPPSRQSNEIAEIKAPAKSVETEPARMNDVIDKSKNYKGLPIDLSSSKRINEIPEIKTSVKNSTEPTESATNAVYPPLSRRFRRIYNPDETASISEYPFMAALLVNGQLWCGAAIISTDSILTAAHCLQLQYNNRFFREYVKMLTVRVGSSNATSGGDIYRVTEIFFHPNYKPNTLEFNFAVVKLHKNLSADSDVKASVIEYSRERFIPTDTQVTFFGWGSVLGFGGMGGETLLQKVNLPVYDFADCQEVYGKELVTRSNFCAGYITLPKNVCNHDAGGPAIMKGRLIGILSFSSKRCDQPDQPAVFSTVGAVAEWLGELGEKRIPTA